MMRYTGSGGFRRSALIAIGLLAAAIAALPQPAIAQEDHSGLTRASFRRNCLLCHHSAAPEGVSPEIMAGLNPVPGLKPRDAMPGVLCQRRCDACKIPDPAAGK
jgi:mono/diheme cytochrome c family protein